jgi:hypothetical protein
MASYRLLAGQHIDKNGTYTAGQVVESDVDLVEKHGAQKFERVGGESGGFKSGTGNPTAGDPTPDNVLHSAATFPHGQVSTGFQQTSGVNPATGVNSGPLNEERARETLGEEDKGQAELPQGQKTQSQTPTAPAQAPTQQAGKQAIQGEQFPAVQGQSPAKSEREYHGQLERLSVRELQSHAEEQEIDLKGASRKDEILKAIKNAG